jgi:chemotaxis protein methyltransferase CheR
MRALRRRCARNSFVADGDAFVPTALQRRVTSGVLWNLMMPEEFEPLARCPIVFCRNAFIYFPAAGGAARRGEFRRRDADACVLCVGASESLLNATRAFSLEELDGAFVYVKRGADE